MSYSLFPRLFLVPLLATTLTFVGASILVFAQEAEEEADPAEITNGERMFLETRFAEFFQQFLLAGGDVNSSLKKGDPILEKTVNWKLISKGQETGPFSGLSMNCRSCHFVDEHLDAPSYGMRTYSDFARRSPIPSRSDGKTVTVRNSPPLVNASLTPRDISQASFNSTTATNRFFHFDAEFPTMVDLVKGTLTGRNYGWLPGETQKAISHIATVVRLDKGSGEVAKEFGGWSLGTLLTGTHPKLTAEFRLPDAFRVDVDTATDLQIFEGIARLITAYTEDLAFSKDDNGNFNLSPYDVFLETNGLSRQPQKWESDISYSHRLLGEIKKHEEHDSLQFISENPHTDNGKFEFLDQPFVFGKEELQGLKIFFTQKNSELQPSDLAQGKAGNCIACHAAPNFTDFRFHNTGIAQAEYDGIHGAGGFKRLDIPDFWTRLFNHNEFLPATENHPTAQEPFRAIPIAKNPQLTDLGLWNIFLNFDFPKQQKHIWRGLCIEALNNFKDGVPHRACRFPRLLRHSIGLFKTPGLRDLSHSAPYSHTGQADTLEEVIRGYIKNAELQRAGELRNGDRRLKKIALTETDITSLIKFLESLNEDYS